MFSTERYESFNHVFRLTCIHSNRQAPSQDTCKTFAVNDTVKHIATGRYWFDNTSKSWRQAGSEILSHMQNHPEHLRSLGIQLSSPSCNGMVRLAFDCRLTYKDLGRAKLKPLARQPSAEPGIPWTETRCRKIPPSLQDSLARSHLSILYRHAVSFLAKNLDTVADDTFVIFRTADSGAASSPMRIGQVKEILVPAKHTTFATHVAIQEFTFQPARHLTLNLPCIPHQVTCPKLLLLLAYLLSIQVIYYFTNSKALGYFMRFERST
jgi:hypothetical protein